MKCHKCFMCACAFIAHITVIVPNNKPFHVFDRSIAYENLYQNPHTRDEVIRSNLFFQTASIYFTTPYD